MVSSDESTSRDHSSREREIVNDELQSQKSKGDPPRKRSKVSRACDSCRRKKIRCNGEYSASLEQVTKVCDSCGKSNEPCTFSRIPLKRGPSKGYNKDSDEKPEFKSRYLSTCDIYGKPQLLSFSQNTHASKNSISGSNSPPIVLPPLINVQQPPKNSQMAQGIAPKSNPSSPRSSITGILNPDNEQSQSSHLPLSVYQKSQPQPIQGPFWKVPYEMPTGSTSNSGSYSSTRRYSLDSTTSNSTVGSLSSRLPSIKPSISVTTTENNSVDSDIDDFYSASSSRRQSSQSLSPKNSIASLGSLQGRMNKNLSIQSSPLSSNSQMSPMYTFPPYQAPRLFLGTHVLHSKVLIENNLRIYYAKIHTNFPILPFSEQYINQIVQSVLNEESNRIIIEIFDAALLGLINYKNLNLNDAILCFIKMFSMYPFNDSSKIDESNLILFFSSLVIANYSILLNGSFYSLGISMTLSIFNDFKILESFFDLTQQGLKVSDSDNTRLLFPRLYYLMSIIDNSCSLTFGIQRFTNNPLMSVMFRHLDYILPFDPNNPGNIDLLRGTVLNDLVSIRDLSVMNGRPSQFRITATNWTNIEARSAISSYFINLVATKFELVDCIIELSDILCKLSSARFNDQDDFWELWNDSQLKLLRLVRKLATSITNFSNYLGNGSTSVEFVSPFMNLSFSQLYRLIKLCKLTIDSLFKYGDKKNLEILNRCIKINNDLSTAFNVLNINLEKSGLGTVAVNFIKNRIDSFNFNFESSYNEPLKNSSLLINSSDENSFVLWKSEFLINIVPFARKESLNGW
ncbi:uncharacterized protein PRCAT00001149001 [Priceomyces carsonii]|uniref:uncharacterized protein n=1 Tax=Priceomyces carsonii TaxID=28549 RepID=UPI002EDB7390|nr:unnamed protein product [Priceomyces carsonii]